jgi:hypothetical protein
MEKCRTPLSTKGSSFASYSESPKFDCQVQTQEVPLVKCWDSSINVFAVYLTTLFQ